MSWIIQSLLNKRDEIREMSDIESDEFNDLIIVEKAVVDLTSQGLLSQEDLNIIGMGEGIPIVKTRNEKYTVDKKRTAICERIAYYLGGYFTNDGYLSYMQNKYQLNEEQVDILRNYISSEYKNKIMRKPIKS